MNIAEVPKDEAQLLKVSQTRKPLSKLQEKMTPKP